jgi:ribonuclease E
LFFVPITVRGRNVQGHTPQYGDFKKEEGDNPLSRKMLINAKHEEECRVAVIENGMLLSFNVEKAGSLKTKGNVYKAIIVRVEPSLQAVFVNFGAKKNGFLPFRDVHPTYFRCEYPEANPHYVNIQEALKTGQELVVQVLREENELKGAALTTYLSIPGRYTVLLPGSEQRGISQKIDDPKQRDRFREMLAELDIPEGLGLIVRTAGEGRTKIEIKKDLSYVLRLWNEIKDKVMQQPNPSILYEESDLASTMVRDYFTPDVTEILVDNKPVYTRIKSFVETVMPRFRSRVKYYQHEEPIFDRYSIESQVDEIFSPRVSLKSGGFIVFTQTEAMVTVDINSGRFKSCDDIEETAYRINVEAAGAISRHLSLRDLGGIIAIDFIDMRSKKHRMNVEKEIKAAFRNDKAKTDFGKIDQFGVLVMSRQRLGTSLQQIISKPCSNCNGTGLVRAPETIAVQILRETRKISLRDNIAGITITASREVAAYLLNRKRAIILDMEKKASSTLAIQWDDDFSNHQYTFSILNRDGQDARDITVSDVRGTNGHGTSYRDRPQSGSSNRSNGSGSSQPSQRPASQGTDRYAQRPGSQGAAQPPQTGSPSVSPPSPPASAPASGGSQSAGQQASKPVIIRGSGLTISELATVKPDYSNTSESADTASVSESAKVDYLANVKSAEVSAQPEAETTPEAVSNQVADNSNSRDSASGRRSGYRRYRRPARSNSESRSSSAPAAPSQDSGSSAVSAPFEPSASSSAPSLTHSVSPAVPAEATRVAAAPASAPVSASGSASAVKSDSDADKSADKSGGSNQRSTASRSRSRSSRPRPSASRSTVSDEASVQSVKSDPVKSQIIKADSKPALKAEVAAVEAKPASPRPARRRTASRVTAKSDKPVASSDTKVDVKASDKPSTSEKQSAPTVEKPKPVRRPAARRKPAAKPKPSEPADS